ncbi:MAG: aminoacyl-tRNA hydrolase [Gemmatimonadetes bacterium]|nr:MAG: aminoacyl-tRNA hydrolase [Gemmatimonadota bacterium]
MTRDSARFGLEITPSVTIPATEIEARATRSSGPGGQHVNKSSTRVELVWTLGQSRAISDAQRARIRDKLAGRLDADGNVRIVASDTRSQRQNRALAEERLIILVRRALAVPKVRKRTKPGKGAIERRLTEKHKHSDQKRERRTRDTD